MIQTSIWDWKCTFELKYIDCSVEEYFALYENATNNETVFQLWLDTSKLKFHIFLVRHTHFEFVHCLSLLENSIAPSSNFFIITNADPSTS